MGEEHCTEDLNQEGYHLLGKMLQGPVRDTVQARCLLILRPLNCVYRSRQSPFIQSAWLVFLV